MLRVATQPRFTAVAASYTTLWNTTPTGSRMFSSSDKADVIIGNCITCQSAGMVLNQRPLSKADWSGEVHKVVGVFKGPVSREDQAAIIDYLAETKGKQ